MIVNLVISFFLLVVFGYLEKTLSVGWLVAGGVVLRALLTSKSFVFSSRTLALVGLFALQFALSDTAAFPFLKNFRLFEERFPFYERQRLSGAVFLGIIWLYLYYSDHEERVDCEVDDVIVDFGPHEQAIRKYLLRHDPSMLHKVDELLLKYTGREDFLMQKLRSRYEGEGGEGVGSPLLQRVNKHSAAAVAASFTPQGPRQEQRDAMVPSREELQYQARHEEYVQQSRHAANVQYQLRMQQEQERELRQMQATESDSDSDISVDFPNQYEDAVYGDEHLGGGPFSRGGRMTPELLDDSSQAPSPTHSFDWQHQSHQQMQYQQQRQLEEQQQWQWEIEREERMQQARQHAREQLRQQQQARARGRRY